MHGKSDESGVTPAEIVTALAELPAGAFVYESELARIFGKCQTSIKRAVERGELPRPIRFMGRPMWTAGSIIKHVECLLERAGEDRDGLGRRIDRLRA